MFKLESNTIKREFKISEDNFYASQILNKICDKLFVPDGNGTEFLIHFTNGEEVSSKGLPVTDSNQDENGKLSFVFAQDKNLIVTLDYWVHEDGDTVCKQLHLSQTDDKVIDYVLLDDIGIINSISHFSVKPKKGSEIPYKQTSLGQPFYIDTLFFGCEFPATSNRIVHGAGQIKYYIGKNVGRDFFCPVTVMGGAEGYELIDLQNAFYKYIDYISTPTSQRFQYNIWFDKMADIDADSLEKLFYEMEKQMTTHGIDPLDAYVVDDGWQNKKGKCWEFNTKLFPNAFAELSAQTRALGSSLGMWLGPRGGYTNPYKIAKRMQRKGYAYVNKESKDICVGSPNYIDNVTSFLSDCRKEYKIDYFKLDGFQLKPCNDDSHGHMVGGEDDMYYVTDLWSRWIEAFKKIRQAREDDLFINMTCYVNTSPWWLQWVNSLWIQNSGDIGFSENIEDQSRLDSELTYRDARYFDCLCDRALQLPLCSIYNHEPIYGNKADFELTDEEFEKYIFWNMVRGSYINELHFSPNKFNESKWKSLSKAIAFCKYNKDALKNTKFIGGNPEENNVYGYISWSDDGQGIIALRNPDSTPASMTVTMNKLMGAPEGFEDKRLHTIYGTAPEFDAGKFKYNDSFDLTLDAYGISIMQIGGENISKTDYYSNKDFTLDFKIRGDDQDILPNENFNIQIKDRKVVISIEGKTFESTNTLPEFGAHVTIVREKNRMIKTYIDKKLDSSIFFEDMSYDFTIPENDPTLPYTCKEGATSYEDLIELEAPIASLKK